MSNATLLMQNLTNITSVNELLTKSNVVLDGMLGIMIWLSVIIVVFITLKVRGYYSSDCFGATIFFGFIIALILRALSVVPEWFFYTNIVLLAITIVVLIVSKSNTA